MRPDELFQRLVGARPEVLAQRVAVDAGVLHHQVIALPQKRAEQLQFPQHVRPAVVGVEDRE